MENKELEELLKPLEGYYKPISIYDYLPEKEEWVIGIDNEGIKRGYCLTKDGLFLKDPDGVTVNQKYNITHWMKVCKGYKNENNQIPYNTRVQKIVECYQSLIERIQELDDKAIYILYRGNMNTYEEVVNFFDNESIKIIKERYSKISEVNKQKLKIAE